MKESTEMRYIIVGSVFFGALLILLFGIFYLNDKDPREELVGYTLMFDQVSTLSMGDPVKVNGVKVGKVNKIELAGRQVEVGIEVREGVDIPVDSDIRVQNIGLLGERQIGIQLGKGSKVLAIGDTLTGVCDAGISEAMAGAGEVFDSSKVLLKTVRDIVDSTIAREQFTESFRNIVDNTVLLQSQVDDLLKKTDPMLSASLSNLKQASVKVNTLLDRNTPALDRIVTDVEGLTKDARRLVGVVDSVTIRLSSITKRLNSTENTAGALLNDKEFYVELRNTVTTADSLLASILEDGLDVNIDLF
jgi:phospholipid/cholesterol/gamma-HCH transport system substrate-binding protein